MSSRRTNGATLALVVCAVVLIVLVASALFFLAELLGGGRELQNTTDSGTRNVAKQALIAPYSKVQNPSNNADITDMNIALGGVTDTAKTLPGQPGVVDLLAFNRLVGQALLVNMNAQYSDPGVGALPYGAKTANQRAAALIDLIEAKNGNGVNYYPSYGKDLTTKLQASNWAQTTFLATASANSMRMFGKGSPVTWNTFKPYYAGTGNNQTNVTLDNVVNNPPFTNLTDTTVYSAGTALAPASVPANAVINGAAAGSSYMQGYQPIYFAGSNRNLYAVPLEPSPHLLSKSGKGADGVTPLGTGNTLTGPPGVSVPPNAFMTTASASDKLGSKMYDHREGLASVVSVAVVGTSQQPFSVSLPHGYIVIDNSSTQSFSGLMPNGLNIFTNELAKGITVDQSGFFSDGGQVEAWENTPRYNANGSTYTGGPLTYDTTGAAWNPATQGPPGAGIFDSNGYPMSNQPADMQNINQNVLPNNTNNVCTDINSDLTANAASPAACVRLAQTSPGLSPNGQDIGDFAYHNNASNQDYATGTPTTTTSITDGESLCFQMLNFWMHATMAQNGTGANITYPYYMNITTAGPTGERLYPLDANGQIMPTTTETPWAPNDGRGFNQAGQNSYSQDNNCQITKDGTIAQLIDQNAIASYDNTGACKALSTAAQQVEKVIQQRMNEILPGGASQYDTVVRKTTLPLGTTMLIYLDTDGKTFKMASTANPASLPPWLNKTNPILSSPTFLNHSASPTFGMTTLNNAASVLNAASETSAGGTDGTPIRVAGLDMAAAQTLMDAHNQGGIHDHPMIDIIGSDGVQYDQSGNSTIFSNANGTAGVHDSAVIVPNSGSFGNLLNVQFLETAQSNGDDNGQTGTGVQGRD